MFNKFMCNFIHIYVGFHGGSNGKESACQFRRPVFHPWFGTIPQEGEWRPTPVFCLEKSIDRGVWWATVHRFAKSQTQLCD